MGKTVYYAGRFGQLLGLWLLIVDIFTAGPIGPSPRLFALGVAVFLAGWGLTKTANPRAKAITAKDAKDTKDKARF